MLRRRTRPRPRRHYLIGVAGHPNFGDEAITRGWLRWLARNHPGDEVWLDVPNASGAAALHHREHPRLVVVDTVHRLGWEAGDAGVESVLAHTRAVLDSPWVAPRWMAGLEALATADVVHAVGGGYLNAHAAHPASVVAALGWAAERPGSRAAATGLGLTPSSPALDSAWRDVGPALCVLTVRDEASRKVAPAATLAPDDIMLGGVEQHLQRDDGAPAVMVVAQGDMHDGFDRLIQTVDAYLDAWDVDPTDLGIVECNPPVDGWIREHLADRFGEPRFYPFSHVDRHGLPVGEGQRWLSTRYHPHLLAAAAGASGVALSVSPDYYGVKHEAATAAGSGWAVRAVGDEPVPAAGSGELPERVSGHAAALEEIARRIYER